MNTNPTTNTKAAVFRFVLTNLGENLVMMDPAAKVVAVQHHKKGVELYALVNPELTEEQHEPRRFYVAKTGEAVEAATFVGTALFPTAPAAHVFELPL